MSALKVAFTRQYFHLWKDGNNTVKLILILPYLSQREGISSSALWQWDCGQERKRPRNISNSAPIPSPASSIRSMLEQLDGANICYPA